MIAKTVVIGWTLFCIFMFFYSLPGAEELRSDPDAGDVILISAFFWVGLWILIAVPTSIIGMLFKKSKAD